MIEKAYLAFVGVVAVATLAAAGVVAACYALFALMSGPLGPAAAAGVTAAVIFLLIGLSALLIALGTKRPARASSENGMAGRIFDLAREKPILAVGALIAAGVVVARNPQVVTAVISGFMAGKSSRKS